MKINYLQSGVLAILILMMGCHSNSQIFKSLIGKEYRTLNEFDLLKDYEEREGMMLECLNGVEYALSQYVKGPINVIAFERIVRQENGQVKYLMLDVLEINGISNKKRVSCGLCRFNEKNDSDIIAVYQAVDIDIHFSKKVKKAWRANRKTEKIEEIDTKGIDCFSEG